MTSAARGARSSEVTPRVRVLVTGASGFVGINLVRGLAMTGHDVIALTRRARDPAIEKFLKGVGDRVEWVRGDVTDRDAMSQVVLKGVTHIVHAAAVTTTVDQERAATAHVFEVNAGGTLNMLEAARKAGIRRFVLVSSGGLYGTAPPRPRLPEDVPVRANNVYAIAKVASEGLARRYQELHGLESVVGRLGTAYGPMERTTGSRGRLSAVHAALTAMVRGAPREVRVRGADIARDFIHIEDAVSAFVSFVDSANLLHAIYNVGSPTAYPLRDALDALSEVTGSNWVPGDEDDPANADVIQMPDSARAAMDTTRLEREFGWKQRYDLAEGTRATLRWAEVFGEVPFEPDRERA